MRFGIDILRASPELQDRLKGKRLALLAHPASVCSDLEHTLDVISKIPGLSLSAAFGPQHGLKGDKQDNMMESENAVDPILGIPVFSLYGDVRRPTSAMMETFDVLLVDLQDLGCRIYTFITTLRYVLEESARHGKSVWILDRPHPVGRPVEGFLLENGWESFVGAGRIPMRHGLTMGEMGAWFISTLGLDLDYQVVKVEGWIPECGPGHGWPLGEKIWINPSPNAPNLWMARAYAGTVMLEGTTLSEGRGTTRPLELFGAPDLEPDHLIENMRSLAPHWLEGCKLRPIWFEPTFHKHAGSLCGGIQIHAEAPFYDHEAFKPWRLQSLAFKAIRLSSPQYPLWRDFPYEYEFERLAIDLINGGPKLRHWVDDPEATIEDLEALVHPDELAWLDERSRYLMY